jgi:hypothetical protein
LSEERPEHPQEPAEGGEEDVQAPGTERTGDGERTAEDGAKPSRHPEEPAEGAEEDVEAPGADRPGDD